MGAKSAAEGEDKIGELLIAAQLLSGGAGDVQNLATQGQHRLRLAIARLLCGSSRRIALHEKDLGAVGGAACAIGELAGQSKVARRRLAIELALVAPPLPLLRALDDGIEQGPRGGGVRGQPVGEVILEMR